MMRTRQEIFNLAWNGLKAQGFRQSAAESGACLFRDHRGRKCAIGHCIPDDAYNPLMDTDGEWWDRAFLAAGIGYGTRRFAEDLQAVHDHADTPGQMEARLRGLARDHSLTIPGEEGAVP